MAFAVKVSKVSDDGRRARYAWESTTGRAGSILLDIDGRVFRPCDEFGDPLGVMSLRVGGDVTDQDPVTAQDFITAVSGILKKWNGSDVPPETAHLYFG
jgi:hypothetical protein